MIALARSIVDDARCGVRAAFGTKALVAFAFADGHIEAYGPDAIPFHQFDHEAAIPVPVDTFDDGTSTSFFSTDLRTMERICKSMTNWHDRLVVVLSADTLKALPDG